MRKIVDTVSPHVSILRCPISQADLRIASADEIKELNQRQAEGLLHHPDGSSVRKPLEMALVTVDGRFAYPVESGIISLLSSLAMVMTPGDVALNSSNPAGLPRLDPVTASVRDFYDQVGWAMTPEGLTTDLSRHEDNRPVSADYRHRCHLRVGRHLPAKGRLILDCASGPLQTPEYLSYSEGFETRICADISWIALKGAREKLGERGLYLHCDMSVLPLKDDCLDAVVSINTLYHLPPATQITAIGELLRALRPGAPAVIVYSWGDGSQLMLPFKIIESFLDFPRRAFRKILRRLAGRTEPALFFQVIPYRRMKKLLPPMFTFKLDVWRSVSVPFLRHFVHERLCGRMLLAAIYDWEERHPRLSGRYGAYPLIIMSK
jgi:SAM-dependent methyltransferase